MKRKSIIRTAVIVASLLLIPLLAMQFTSEVKWQLNDFLAAAILLFGTGLILELVIQKITNTKTRIILCVAVVLILLLVWADLAVGIFGMPWSGS